MADNINPDKIQKLLLFLAPQLQDRYEQSNIKGEYEGISFAYTNTNDNSGSIPITSGTMLYQRQQQFFSGMFALNGDSANAFFSDGTDNKSINYNRPGFHYTINNRFIFLLDGSYYYFDIENANRDATLISRIKMKQQDNIYEPSFLFTKMDIQSNSTNAIGMRPSYTFKFEISFSDLESLTQRLIVARKIGSDDDYIKIPLMGLLYGDFLKPDTNLQTVSLKKSYAVMPDGLFLQQTIKFKNLSTAVPSEISKTYHLMHYNHSYDMYKKNEVIGTPLENVLSIEYTSYEADSIDKYPSDKIPVSMNNMFNLLNNQNYTNGVKKRYTNFIDLQKALDLKRKLLKNAQYITQRQVINESELKNYQDAIKELNSLMPVFLVESILENVDVYSISLPRKSLGNWTETQKGKDFLNSLKDNIDSGIMVDALVDLASVGIGTVVVAGSLLAAAPTGGTSVGTVGMGAASIILGLNNLYKAWSELSAKAGAGTEDITINMEGDIIIPSNVTLQKQKTAGVESTIFQIQKKIDVEKTRNQLQNYLGISTSGQPSDVEKVHFVFFKDILNFIRKTCITSDINNLPEVLCMNYLVPIGNTYKAINIGNIPIYSNSLSQHLIEYILNKDYGSDDFMYSTDDFIVDIYDNLIRRIMDDVMKEGDMRKMRVPQRLMANTTTHDSSYSNILDNFNIMNSQHFKDKSQKFINTQNIFNNSSGGVNLKKILTFGAVQSLSYNTVFSDFNNDTNYKDNKISKFLNFQKYIINKYQMPCITIERIKRYNNILKTKYVNFSRVDNNAILMANMSNALFFERLPYKFDAELHSYMWFFLNIYSNMFVAPPYEGVDEMTNFFNFGGLYTVLECKYEHYFQTVSGNEDTLLPNEKSSCKISALGQNTIELTGNISPDYGEEIVSETDTTAPPGPRPQVDATTAGPGNSRGAGRTSAAASGPVDEEQEVEDSALTKFFNKFFKPDSKDATTSDKASYSQERAKDFLKGFRGE